MSWIEIAGIVAWVVLGVPVAVIAVEATYGDDRYARPRDRASASEKGGAFLMLWALAPLTFVVLVIGGVCMLIGSAFEA